MGRAGVDLKVGDFVIVGDFDCPRPQNVAMVTELHEKGQATVRYIARRFIREDSTRFRKPWKVQRYSLTKIDDFGIVAWGLFLNDDKEWYLKLVQNDISCATYEDGTARRWQDDGLACVLSDEMAAIVAKTRGVYIIPFYKRI